MSPVHVWPGDTVICKPVVQDQLKTKLLSWTRFLALLDLVETSSCSLRLSFISYFFHNSLSVGFIASLYHLRLMPRALSFHTTLLELLRSPFNNIGNAILHNSLWYYTDVLNTRIREMKGWKILWEPEVFVPYIKRIHWSWLINNCR